MKEEGAWEGGVSLRISCNIAYREAALAFREAALTQHDLQIPQSKRTITDVGFSNAMLPE